MGQEGDQILTALFSRPGGVLPGLETAADGVQIPLQRGQLPGEGHLSAGEIGDAGGGRADLIQPAGKAAQGQIEGNKHEDDHAQHDPLRLIAADIVLIGVQGDFSALTEQVGGSPDKEPVEGVLQKAVDDHFFQKKTGSAGDSRSGHHQKKHLEFEAGIAFFLHGALLSLTGALSLYYRAAGEPLQGREKM